MDKRKNLISDFEKSSIHDTIVNTAITKYNFGSLVSVEQNKVGRYTHYIIETDKGKYFVKVLDRKNENVHMQDEIVVCNTLRAKGMKTVPQYAKRADNEYLTQVDQTTFFNVQGFIEGDTWAKYKAPDWLLNDAASFIGDVHNNLADITLPQRPAIMRLNDTESSMEKLAQIKKSIAGVPNLANNELIQSDLLLREKVIDGQKPFFLIRY